MFSIGVCIGRSDKQSPLTKLLSADTIHGSLKSSLIYRISSKKVGNSGRTGI